MTNPYKTLFGARPYGKNAHTAELKSTYYRRLQGPLARHKTKHLARSTNVVYDSPHERNSNFALALAHPFRWNCLAMLYNDVSEFDPRNESYRGFLIVQDKTNPRIVSIQNGYGYVVVSQACLSIDSAKRLIDSLVAR